MAHLFGFKEFINNLREDEGKKRIIEKYESNFGPIGADLKKQVWYTEYVKAFEAYYPKEGILVPDGMEDDFDWKLLFALVTASFSSSYRFEKPEGIARKPWRLWIKVTGTKEDSGEEVVVEKSIDELWSFQIMNLYRIYVEEQINLQNLRAEEPEDWEGVNETRNLKLDKIKNEVKKTTKQDEEEIIYHYTSVSTLTEILRSNKLRASDLRFLNDRTEKIKWFEVFDFATQEVYKKIDGKAKSDEKKKFLDEIGNRVRLYKNVECYKFCLSRLPDDKNQFVLYGDQCRGVSIGFKRQELVDRAFEFNADADQDANKLVSGMLHGDVEYDEQKLQKQIIKMIEDLLKFFNKSKKNTDSFLDSITLSEYFNKECNRIFMRCQDAKDDSFKSEKEYCLYWQQESDKRNKKVDLFHRKCRMIPFVTLEFGEKKLPISEVIVGPANNDDVFRNIKEVMELMGYENVNVRKSKIPYSD